MTANGNGRPAPYTPRDFILESMQSCLAAMMADLPVGGVMETTAESLMAVAFRYGCVLGVEKPDVARQLAYDVAALKEIDLDPDPTFAQDRRWADQMESLWTGWPIP